MKKRMILALVLVFALLCLACSHDADDGTSESSLTSEQSATSESSASPSISSADGTTSADGTSGETSTESNTLSDTSGTTTSAESTSSDTSTGTESSATSSDTSTSSKPAENSESSKPTEGSENSKPSENSDTSSGSGNPSQTAHTHNYKTTVVKPTCTENGYTLHKCSCGDSYTDSEIPATGHKLNPNSYGVKEPPTYTTPPVYERTCIYCNQWFVDPDYETGWEPAMTGTEEDLALVRERFKKVKGEYPEGTKWDSSCKYSSVAFGMNGSECAGFALLTSDYLFGTYWNGRHSDVVYDNLLPGDIVHIAKEYNGGQTGHWVVIMEVFDDHVTVVEGNYGGTVHWGRNINREAIEHGDELLTRYNPPPRLK